MTNETKKRIIETVEELKNSLTVLQKILAEDAEGTEPQKAEEKSTSNKSAPRKVDEKMVKELLKDIGIPVNLKGYSYIVYGICYLAENRNSVKYSGITNSLYPSIAKKFGTTASRVERSIRHSVERAFSIGNRSKLNEVFGYVVKSKNGKVTNSEFMWTCVQYLEDRL